MPTLPVPLGIKERCSLLPVVISVVTAEKVRVPVVVIAPDATVPMLTRLPVESILCVPAPAPVFIPVVPLMVVPVMVLAVVIVPNPEAIEPEANAPTVVNEEVNTPVPRVVEDKTSVPLIWYVLPVDKFIVPVFKTTPEPFRGDKVMLPVVAPPMVKVLLEVV